MREVLIARCTARIDTNITNINKTLQEYRSFVEKEDKALDEAQVRLYFVIIIWHPNLKSIF